ncbi:MAG TPA: alginate export family protein [Luteolibacter sp.]
MKTQHTNHHPEVLIPNRKSHKSTLVLALLAALPLHVNADAAPAAQLTADNPHGTAKDADTAGTNKAEAKKTHFVKARSNSTTPLSEPPPYVRQLDKTGLPILENYGKTLFQDYSWLDVGLEYRIRYEHRDNDLQRPTQETNDPFYHRTRGYLGIKDILDPLRFAVEFQDSRVRHSGFPKSDDTSGREINEWGFIQAFAELHFKDFAESDKTLRVQGGRIAFEELDRRLIARNEWRNTTNNFDGFRAVFGDQNDDFQVDAFALQPVVRTPSSSDRANENIWFYGAIGHLRQWSDIITLQPAYFLLDRNEEPGVTRRHIHTAYLRGYGDIGKTGFDYDLTSAYQFGDANTNATEIGDHDAQLATAEIGYRLQDEYKSRFSLFGGYASGDASPTDSESNRFERLFGFARPWSSNDYITPENIITAKARFEFQPHEKVRVDGGYSIYWLASDTDSFVNANLRDTTGNSGSSIGQELDLRLRIELDERIDLNVGYAYFLPGDFTEKLGKGKESHFAYAEATFRLF